MWQKNFWLYPDPTLIFIQQTPALILKFDQVLKLGDPPQRTLGAGNHIMESGTLGEQRSSALQYLLLLDQPWLQQVGHTQCLMVPTPWYFPP